MRTRLIAGIVMVALGAFVLLRGASFISQRDVLRVGDVKVTADERQSIPPWMGGAVMVMGVALLVTGVRRRA